MRSGSRQVFSYIVYNNVKRHNLNDMIGITIEHVGGDGSIADLHSSSNCILVSHALMSKVQGLAHMKKATWPTSQCQERSIVIPHMVIPIAPKMAPGYPRYKRISGVRVLLFRLARREQR